MHLLGVQETPEQKKLKGGNGLGEEDTCQSKGIRSHATSKAIRKSCELDCGKELIPILVRREKVCSSRQPQVLVADWKHYWKDPGSLFTC